MRPTDLDLLRESPMFRDLVPETLKRLIEGCFVQGLPRGAVLFHEGEQPEFCHVILSGRVGLFAADADQRDVVVEFFGAGDLFIAPAVILDQPYLMSARVTADSRILMIPAEGFRRALEQEPTLALACTRQLARYWRLLIEQIKELKLKSAPQRLGSYLLSAIGPGKGPASIMLGEERKVLAGRLGMTPESLSRSLAQLRAIGVTTSGRQVSIANVERLRAYCQAGEPAARAKS
jgi:CRP/FNR family transcriptional activator FtrB